MSPREAPDMLEMRPQCEKCGRDLPPHSPDALICSFECTFCRHHDLPNCPNCGGDLVTRPTRAAHLLEKYPVVRKFQASIEINDSGYLLRRDDGSQSQLLHSELQAVEILNEDEVYFLLVGPNSSLVIPQATVGSDTLLTHLQKLPGFKNEVFLEAMSENGKFSCWP